MMGRKLLTYSLLTKFHGRLCENVPLKRDLVKFSLLPPPIFCSQQYVCFKFWFFLVSSSLSLHRLLLQHIVASSALFTPCARYESRHTVAEDDEPQEGQVTLSLYGVPAEVRVSLSNQHGTALETTACQVCHHLHTHTHVSFIPAYYEVFLTVFGDMRFLFLSYFHHMSAASSLNKKSSLS